MCIYIRNISLLITAFLSFFTFNAFSMIEDGEYRIRCHTRNGGERCLEAFADGDVVRPRVESPNIDQKWSVKYIGNKSYNITCFTKNGGIRYLEAFANGDIVRPRAEWPGNVDQMWMIDHIDGDFYHISCNTKNGGLRCLEAFANGDIVRPREKSLDQDQKWQFVKWK